MRPTLWPRSLFGRLIAATVLGVLLAEAVGLYLVTRNGERLVVAATTGMWARRITAITRLLERLPAARRAELLARLQQAGSRRPGDSGPMPLPLRGMLAIACAAAGPCALRPPVHPVRPAAHRRWFPPGRRFGWGRLPPGLRVRLPFRTHEDRLLARHLRADLGSGYRVTVGAASAPAASVIGIPGPFFGARTLAAGFFDVRVRTPDHAALVFRVARLLPQMPLPRRLLLNLLLLVVVLVVALYVATRGITRPLSRLARAAEAIGQGGRAPPLREEGARELRHAARAFNTMQDRLHRYLDSRTRVLAAMSHDLKTPLTRLRLQVETLLEDPALRARFEKELDEMQSMVHGALALFRGLDEQAEREPVDVNALLESLREGFVETGAAVSVSGRALAPYLGRPQALKRCLTNLISNAVKFGKRAEISVQDGEVLRICVRDDGPGIAPEELERVFEPFYRVESSRNRTTGGTGLGLGIARDVAQAHGGTVLLRNRPQGGLEAELSLPRHR